MSHHLIHGFFYQWRSGLGTDYVAPEGLVAVIRTGITRGMFSGGMWIENGVMVGQLEDHYGSSTLSNILHTPDHFSFTKMYHRRDRPQSKIEYKFFKHGEHWLGEYDGEFSGQGVACCTVTKVPDEFFDVEALAKIVGRESFLVIPKLE